MAKFDHSQQTPVNGRADLFVKREMQDLKYTRSTVDMNYVC